LNNLLPCIIKTDSLGNIIWNKIYPAGLPAGPFGLALDSGYVQMGNDGFANTLFLVKTDMNGNSGCAEGNIEFTVTNVNITDTSVTLLVDSGGTSTNVTLPSVNVTPFHSICSTTSINENISFASLNEIHISPNPTNDFLTIHYNLSSPQQTTISLFNLYGQKIKTIYNGKQPAGEHEIKTGMKDVAGGVYFVKMDIGGKEEVRKVVKY
ncbi:MAG: T9SS type A sorting domain-containing protein, partial [Bacteroidota bacterium]